MNFQIAAGTANERTSRRKEFLMAAGGAALALTVAAGLGTWQAREQTVGSSATVGVTADVHRSLGGEQPKVIGGVAEPYTDQGELRIVTTAGPRDGWVATRYHEEPSVQRTSGGYSDATWSFRGVGSHEEAAAVRDQLRAMNHDRFLNSVPELDVAVVVVGGTSNAAPAASGGTQAFQVVGSHEEAAVVREQIRAMNYDRLLNGVAEQDTTVIVAGATGTTPTLLCGESDQPVIC
jgi:hypothetical protein